jgi:hypothetical protein
MIQANELRIGNWVKHLAVWSYRNEDMKEHFFKFEQHDWYADCECTFSLDSIDPIPLTEEILLKCGFEKTNRIDFGELKECYANFSFALMIRHNSFFTDWFGGSTEIKYLHQLQNIYYFLHNEELTVEL